MTIAAADGRTQRFRALDRANDIRSRRAGLKRALHDRSARLEDVLGEPEWWLFGVPICELLAWLPRVGPVKVNRALRRADVWPLREVGQLTVRQRLRVLAEVSR